MLRVTLVAVCLAVLAFACDDGDGGPNPTPEPTSTLVHTQAPDNTRTGIPDLDNVLDALFSGDAAAIQALVAFTPVPCEIEPIGLGPPPTCRADEPEGTLVDVFPHAYCEGVYIRPEDMDGRYASLANPDGVLYAVYHGSESFSPSGEFVVVFPNRISSRPGIALAAAITGGRIVGSYSGCGGTPEEFVTEFGFASDGVVVGPLWP